MGAKPKVFVARPIPEEAERYIAEHCEVRKWTGPGRMSREVLFESLADAEGLLTSGTPINATLLDHAPKLKVVSLTSVGYNVFDLDEMRRRGVIGTHTPHVLDDTVADLILGLMISAARRIPELDRFVRKGLWRKGMDEEFFGVDVHHQTLGIIGMGRIGEAVARRAHHGFGMKVLYSNRSRNAAAEERVSAEYVPLDRLLAESDFIVVMTPLTKETEKMIGAAQFAKMKPSAIFVNASRGRVVDEAALIEALQNGVIRAAGLDVFEVEPIEPDNPLLSLDNVVLLPHIGSSTRQTRHAMAMLAARNLVAGVLGETPPYVVPELRDLLPGNGKAEP